MATAYKTPGPRRRYRNPLELYRRYAQPKRVRRIETVLAGPLPDEPEFNEETKQSLRESMAGEGLVRHDSLEDFFAAHGL